MTTIKKGTTNDVGTKFWEIIDDEKLMTAEFNHNRFRQILHGAAVYFIDLDLDRLCENVQLVADVDGEIRRATPESGEIEADAEKQLRDYVMSALLHSLNKQGAARNKYFSQLKDKMNDVRRSAESKENVVTLAILAFNGIS